MYIMLVIIMCWLNFLKVESKNKKDFPSNLLSLGQADSNSVTRRKGNSHQLRALKYRALENAPRVKHFQRRLLLFIPWNKNAHGGSEKPEALSPEDNSPLPRISQHANFSQLCRSFLQML